MAGNVSGYGSNNVNDLFLRKASAASNSGVSAGSQAGKGEEVQDPSQNNITNTVTYEPSLRKKAALNSAPPTCAPASASGASGGSGAGSTADNTETKLFPGTQKSPIDESEVSKQPQGTTGCYKDSSGKIYKYEMSSDGVYFSYPADDIEDTDEEDYFKPYTDAELLKIIAGICKKERKEAVYEMILVKGLSKEQLNDLEQIIFVKILKETFTLNGMMPTR